MKKLLPFLSIGYVIYALLVAWFVCQTLLQVYRAYSTEAMQVSSIQWVPVAVLVIIATAFICMFLCLAYFLSTRRQRRGAMIIAGISCLGIPVGTILGALTLYALTRPEISSEFTPTVNQSLEPTAGRCGDQI
jgi:MFS family permease